MKKILFFIHNGWAFGNIHNELRKCLYPEYDCDYLCWSQSYTQETFNYLIDKYDLFWSTPEGAFSLHNLYGVPLDKIVGMAHQDWDIYHPLASGVPKEHYSALRGYAVVGPKLLTVSLAYDIARIPAILPVGVHVRNYERPMSTEVKKLGYFGRLERWDRTIDVKRGRLALEVAKRTGMEVVAPQFVQEIHYLASDRLYREIDLLMFCSLVEGQPCVAFEAMAAGVPVLGTDAGLFGSLATGGGGGVLPYEEDKFVAEAVEVIHALQSNHELYAMMHRAALQTASTFDWAVLKPQWLEYLGTLFS